MAISIDAEVRRYLRELKPNQKELATAIGARQSWLNKWMHGSGNASIDQVIRILAWVLGTEAQRLTDVEWRVVKALRALPPERQEDAAVAMSGASKGFRHALRPESDVRKNDTPQVKARRARGTRQA